MADARIKSEFPFLRQLARKSLTTAEQNAEHNSDLSIKADLYLIVEHYRGFYLKRVELLNSLADDVLKSLDISAQVLLHESPSWKYFTKMTPANSGYEIMQEVIQEEEREARALYIRHVFSI
jgi:hypothetical protein